MKILLAVDGSPHSDAAIEEITKRPWPPHSEVKVITVIETPLTVGIGVEPWPPDYFEQLQKSAREAARTVIDNALRKLNEVSDKTLKISHEIIGGPARQVIVEEAESWGADLIVIGSRGLGVWNRLLLGSVSSAVVNHAKCSVEVVRMSQPGGGG
jgi:nucleotide-binding universal stress UspA family protein